MLPEVHIYIDRSEAETWNHDEIDNLQGKINTGEYSMSKVIIIGGGAAGMMGSGHKPHLPGRLPYPAGTCL